MLFLAFMEVGMIDQTTLKSHACLCMNDFIICSFIKKFIGTSNCIKASTYTTSNIRALVENLYKRFGLRCLEESLLKLFRRTLVQSIRMSLV